MQKVVNALYQIGSYQMNQFGFEKCYLGLGSVLPIDLNFSSIHSLSFHSL